MGLDRCLGAFQIGERVRRRGRRDQGRHPGWSRRDAQPGEELRAPQARVPRAAIGIEDLEDGAPPRGAVAVAGHLHVAALAHHVPAQPDPARAPQLQAQAAGLLHGRRKRAAQHHGLQHHEQRARPPGERGEPAQPVPHPLPCHGRVPPVRQVQHRHIHRPRREQRTGHRQRLVQVHRRQHHQPLRPHAACHCLHGIERSGEVQPGGDRTAGLCLRDHPQRRGGLAAGRVPTERHRGRARKATGAQDGIQRGEPRGHHPAVGVRVRDPRAARDHRGEGRGGERVRVCRQELRRGVRGRHRRPGKGAFDHETMVSAAPWSGRAPACLERRESLGDV